MAPKAERFEMRLEAELLDKVEEWRRNEYNIPSRAEAIRRLVESGLKNIDNERFRISDGEKLIALMLCDLYERLEIDGEFDPDLIKSAIYGGHFWGLKWHYSGVFHGHGDDPRTVKEVVDILDMWSFLEQGYDKLTQPEKERVAKEADYLGEVKFEGFDGNNEGEYMGVSSFLVDKLGRFESFAGRSGLNSHMPTLNRYRRMVSVFKPMRRALIGVSLSGDQIITILTARRLHVD